MNDIDMIFLYKSYFTEADLSFLEGIDKEAFKEKEDQEKNKQEGDE